MAKDPAILFYTSDFLTGTMFMSNEQVGIYIRLLLAQHQHGGLIDKQSFESAIMGSDIIRKKFIETKDGFYNERMMLEMHKRNNKSKNISKAVLKVWQDRKKENEIAFGSQKDSNAIVMGIESESEVKSEDNKIFIKKNIISKVSIKNETLKFATQNKPFQFTPPKADIDKLTDKGA